MPMMAVSTGVSLQPSAMRAELPETAMTRSRISGADGIHGYHVAGFVLALRARPA